MKHIYKSSILNFRRFDYYILDNEYNDKYYYILRISFASLDSNNLYIFFQRIQYSIRLIFNIII